MTDNNFVEFIIYIYDDQSYQEQHFQFVDDLLCLLNDQTDKTKACWIEVINRSDVELPASIKTLCEYFHIHPLTIEDITTITPNMKLDLFHDQPILYLLIQIISWNDKHVEQQQLSLYLKYFENILITFQNQSTRGNDLFDEIRNRLRRQRIHPGDESFFSSHGRLKQMHVDYLFYCLLDAIIVKYMDVLEDIAIHVDHFDEQLMTNKRSLSLDTFYRIYRVRHDLLHLRILFNRLKETISRLQRTNSNTNAYRRTDHTYRMHLNHRLVRRQNTIFRLSPQTSFTHLSELADNTNSPPPRLRRPSIVFNEYIYMYLNDLQDHINQSIDTVEIQRESVAALTSLWINLNNNGTQEILKLLMLITVLFMPCIFLTALSSTNFQVQPQLQYEYGYYIILTVLGSIIVSMVTWYKLKRWI
ncbi:unnamed protein product [Adineta ricciae]|uniref:Uncharacterized protein n=2 Tax=Adineta ricciae TaxID=249248 RepID=A0A813MK99_ADIRI|nr:unnamed protein product [Adineta ricciae]